MTHDISTTYLGLPLRSPLMPAASPLAADARRMLEMENSGAGAIVLPSLFEDPAHPEALEPGPYADRLATAKTQVSIPIIASLNACSLRTWVDSARLIEQAGADALELNIYNATLSPNVPSSEVEQSYVDIVAAIRHTVRLPLAVKLSPFFTNLPRLALGLQEAGADGLVLFNRFYQSDLDLDGFEPASPMSLSTAAENRLPRRWIALLSHSLRLDLAANSGLRPGSDVLKAVLCGASVAQVCSVLLQRGIPWLMVLETELRLAMEHCEISSLRAARGQLSQPVSERRGEVERAEYRTALQGYSQLDVPSWKDEIPLPPLAESTL